MRNREDLVRVLEPGDPGLEVSTVEDFLHRLGGPTWLRIPGEDRSRTRAVVTLLHGNEPSGVRAVHGLLRSGFRPSVDLVCFVGSVQAALAAPGFAHRMLPGCRDLNRAFRPPFDGVEGRVAQTVLHFLREARAEALIDLHNTSGAGPAYGVSTRVDPGRLALTSLFADHLIVTDLRLGSLMEAVEDEIPVVTIECGGAGEKRADILAREGLRRFARTGDVFSPHPGRPFPVVLRHPLRVELAGGARVAYEDAPAPAIDLTLRRDVDRKSFGIVRAGEPLGWTGPRGLDAIRVRTALSVESPREYFDEVDGRLVASRPLRIFMVTTNPAIALSDCLFYFIPEGGAEMPRPGAVDSS